MRWHERSALWVALARGKPLEQKDRDGRVCAVPQYTQRASDSSRELHDEPTVRPAHASTRPRRLHRYCFKIAIVLSKHVRQRSKWLMTIVTLDADTQRGRPHLSDRGMSARMILYKRVRWEERCRLGCKCSVGRLGPVLTALRSTELETCEYANTLT